MFKKRINKPVLIPIEDFFQAYFDCRKRKRKTANALKFERDYEENLVKLWKEVNNRKYKIGKSITFIVTRPKYREVFAADFRDRIVHHIIMQRLEPLFEESFIDDCYSCRKNKGTLYGVTRLSEKIKEASNNYTEECWIGKFDIKGFFMSIHKSILWSMTRDYVEKNYQEKDKELLLWLLEKVILHSPQLNCIKRSAEHLWKRIPANKSLFTCDPDCGLPIGNLTSQCLANFYLNEFDHIVSKKFNGFYGRYVDDFYIISKNKKDILDYIPVMKDWLWNNLKLRLHDKKLYIQRYEKGVVFIGSVIKKNRIYFGNASKGGLYSAIHRYNVMCVDKDIAIEFVNVLNSYLGFMKYQRAYKIKLKIKGMIELKWYNYFYWKKDLSKVILCSDVNPNTKLYSQIKKEGLENIFPSNPYI